MDYRDDPLWKRADAMVGGEPRTVRTWVSGEDATATALAAAVRHADAVAEQLDRTTSPTARGVFQRNLDATAAEIERLETHPIEGYWEEVETSFNFVRTIFATVIRYLIESGTHTCCESQRDKLGAALDEIAQTPMPTIELTSVRPPQRKAS